MLPFADGTFHAVTANFVVNHVPDPRGAVRDLARVLRPGGRVAMTIWPAEPPSGQRWSPGPSAGPGSFRPRVGS